MKSISPSRAPHVAEDDAAARSIHRALSRCLAALDRRAGGGAPFEAASEMLAVLVPALHRGDAEAARAAVLSCDLSTREALDLVLRARAAVRRTRAPARADREHAADAALAAVVEKDDASQPDEAERRRQLFAIHRRLLSLLTDGVLTVHPEGRLVHANRAARDALDLRLRDLRETPLPALFADPAEGRRVWDALTAQGHLRACEADLATRDGKRVPVRLAAARAESKDPRVLVVFRDLTEIRHIRSRLLETEKLGAMAKIAGSVAHEIRNPLNALFLNADLLEDELSEVPAGIEEILRVMREEIDRLNEIIKNYLSLSKLGAASFEPLDLNQVVRELVEETEEEASRREIALDVRLSRYDTPVRADRNMLRRAIVNLVQNAFDATPPGGRVVIGTRRLLHKVKLWVRDSGPGLPADAEDQLFQPFFSTKERGTGLGLYLIREIVMAHDGKVALRSIEPRGTQATVFLPRLREEKEKPS